METLIDQWFNGYPGKISRRYWCWLKKSRQDSIKCQRAWTSCHTNCLYSYLLFAPSTQWWIAGVHYHLITLCAQEYLFHNGKFSCAVGMGSDFQGPVASWEVFLQRRKERCLQKKAWLYSKPLSICAVIPIRAHKRLHAKFLFVTQMEVLRGRAICIVAWTCNGDWSFSRSHQTSSLKNYLINGSEKYTWKWYSSSKI